MAVNPFIIYTSGELLLKWREKVDALDGLRSSSVNGTSFQMRDAQLGSIQREITLIANALYAKDPDKYADYKTASVTLADFRGVQL